ncbi:ZIP family metal transporter [Streptomyces sp. NPDC055036]
MAVYIALGAFIMTLIGGLTAQRVTDRRHLVLGLAGGLMLGVVGLDLLPEAMRVAGDNVFGVPQALVLFVSGFLVTHVTERLLAFHTAPHTTEHTTRKRAVSMTVHGGNPAVDAGPGASGIAAVRVPKMGLAAASAMIVHSVMDGVAIGAAFQIGRGLGTAVALAVVAHDFADGFNTYTITSLHGNDRRRALTMLFADAIAPVVGACSTLLFILPEKALGSYLGFFSGALLYLAAAEILPEAHHDHPARSTLLCTMLGVGFVYLVVSIGT